MNNYKPLEGSSDTDAYLSVLGKKSDGCCRLYGRGVTSKMFKKVKGTENSYVVTKEVFESITNTAKIEKSYHRGKAEMEQLLREMSANQEKQRVELEEMRRNFAVERESIIEDTVKQFLAKLPTKVGLVPKSFSSCSILELLHFMRLEQLWYKARLKMQNFHDSKILDFSNFGSKSCYNGFIGVNIETDLSDMPSPTQVVALLKAQQIRHVRLFDTDKAMLLALANTGIRVTVSVPNDQLLGIGQSNATAANWVSRNVIAHVPATNITSIAIGSEVLTAIPNAAPILVSEVYIS